MCSRRGEVAAYFTGQTGFTAWGIRYCLANHYILRHVALPPVQVPVADIDMLEGFFA